jgi:hypothetical protein
MFIITHRTIFTIKSHKISALNFIPIFFTHYPSQTRSFDIHIRCINVDDVEQVNTSDETEQESVTANIDEAKIEKSLLITNTRNCSPVDLGYVQFISSYPSEQCGMPSHIFKNRIILIDKDRRSFKPLM